MEYNILFYTKCKVSSTKGGTERATISTATILKEFYHCKCYSIYSIKLKTALEDCFVADFEVDYINNQNKIIKIIEQYNIDIVIVQTDYVFISKMRKKLPRGKTKYIFAHHFEPGWEVKLLTLNNLCKQFHKDTGKVKIKDTMKMVLFPLCYVKNFWSTKREYKEAYEFSDRTVLLSGRFVDQFKKFSGIQDTSKIVVIPNTLSFPLVQPIDLESSKEKKVLIVSRIQDRQKRILLALKIWKKIKLRDESKGWSLDVVGDGPDLKTCVNYVKRHNMRDVNFYGKKVPDPFYKKSSIFMMTSRSEGWGLTITEAQQYSVVPVAFDTVSVFKDIIQNGKNGFLVKNEDISDYINKICYLMAHKEKRERMAINGYRSCQAFCRKRVGLRWKNLIDEVCEEND